MKFIYLKALRDEYFVPWVSGSRLADFRGFSLPVAKVAVSNILSLMKEGKLALFNLHIAVDDRPKKMKKYRFRHRKGIKFYYKLCDSNLVRCPFFNPG